MRLLDAAQTAAALPWRPLVEALREGFQQGCEAPIRHQHQIEVPGEQAASLLLMPAWQSGGYLGVKQIMVVPENSKRGLAAVSASYLLYNAVSGQALAMLDGNALTHRRTAAASALAADYLAKPTASRLLMIGTGGLAPNLIAAHAEVRQLEKIQIWGRNFAKAQALASDLRAQGYPCEAADDLPLACEHAEIISCATLSEHPLVLSQYLTQGCHLDLVGAFTPTMCEADAATIKRGQVFVDTLEGALAEAGDLIQAIETGAISARDIKAELADLCRGDHAGRISDNDITIFKSVGTALEDLVAARLALGL